VGIAYLPKTVIEIMQSLYPNALVDGFSAFRSTNVVLQMKNMKIHHTVDTHYSSFFHEQQLPGKPQGG